MSRGRWVGPGRFSLTAAAGAGLVWLAVLSPTSIADPDPRTTPAGASSLAPVVSTSLSCPGPELSGVDGVEDIVVPAEVGAAAAPQDVIDPVRPGGGGSLVVRSGSATSEPSAVRGATTTVSAVPGVASEVNAEGAMAPGLAATQEWAVARSEIRGLATVPCSGPGTDLWLLAGGGSAGRQERLVLTNPGANEVTVDVQAFGVRGPLLSPTGSTVVPAHGRVAMLVDAVTGAEESPAVRVRANGGSVQAVISDIWLDGSVPAGAETTMPTAAPATRQVIPAAMISGTGSIRIAVPGTKQAVVSARVVGKDGVSPLPGGGVARVPGRSTGELPVTGLPEGVYAVELTSDVPVVASLFASWRQGEAAGDFVWAPSTDAASGLLGAAYPDSEGPITRTLGVVASGAPAKVAVSWRAGGTVTTKTVDLGQDSSTFLELGDVESVWVRRTSGTGQLRAAVASSIEPGRFVSVSPLARSVLDSAVSRAHPAS